jgi:hypothetical protein
VLCGDDAGANSVSLQNPDLVNGPLATPDYTAAYDGALNTVTASPGMMVPVSLTRVDTRTVEARYVRGLRVQAITRRLLSDDGRFMTVTTEWHTADGGGHKNTAVFERR